MRTIRTRAGTLVLALLLAALVVPAAHAQTGAASITGLVTDQSGAATPGAAVIAAGARSARMLEGGRSASGPKSVS